MSEATFKDYFSSWLARLRQMSAKLPRWVVRLPGVDRLPRRAWQWDCATGSGQAAVSLAGHFDRVIATDASRQQLDQAMPHDRVTYQVAQAQRTGIASGSVDLVTVAQALHWFDIPRFFNEAKRVLKPGGVVAVWCYSWVRTP